MEQVGKAYHGEDGGGFRLDYLEFYNWGTFHEQVWRITPNLSTALLTGANGSGKSTLVDALLTLLVPSRQRNYNQASGATRRERDEASYVRGAYGRLYHAQSERGAVQYLRNKDTYSVLLAYFSNTALRQAVTLAQVFTWGRDDELKKSFVVAPTALSILEHFQLQDGLDSLRKRLRSLGAEVYDEWSRYHKQIIRLFGLRSAKALDLFNQTVAIKEIGGLNEFVRQHMLEKGNAPARISELREHFDNLTTAHAAIERAEQQLARLRPLMQVAEHFQQAHGRVTETEQAGLAVPFYMAGKKQVLLHHAILASERDLEFAQTKLVGVAEQLERLREQERDIYVAIRSDQVGQRLNELAREIAELTNRAQRCHVQAERYEHLAQRLQFPVPKNEAMFVANRTNIAMALPTIETNLQRLVYERDQHKQEETRLIKEIEQTRGDLTALKGRQSRIPAESLNLRSQLAAALNLNEADLPFVGELLKVRSEAQAWEGAIQRLLYGYARQLLVTNELYPTVSAYVDRTNLRGRLVYQRVVERRGGQRAVDTDTQLLVNKLEIKPQTHLYTWLFSDLLEHWDYVCCSTLDQFQRERRALTINGQVRSGVARHEKDDRFALNDHTRYALGWDNRDLIVALQHKLASQEQRLQATRENLIANKQEQQTWDQRKDLVRDLDHFEHFEELDWRTVETALHERQAEHTALAQSNDRIQQLQAQRATVQAQIQHVDAEKIRIQQIIATHENDLKRYRGQATPELARMAQDPTLRYELRMRIENDLKGRGQLTLENMDTIQREMERTYTNSANTLRGNSERFRDAVIKQMAEFRREYPVESSELDASVEAISGFRHLLERIERDDLPTYQRRFKEWLDGKVLEAVTGFHSALELEESAFQEAVATLNESLQRIDYTTATYIRLRADATRESEIMAFRQELRHCFPDSGQFTPETNEISFQRIRQLIERFERDERWTNRVTDVRNWLDFAAEERYRADNSEKNFYSDSSGKSGGQKAKLAYTILASAIAYQYGLDQPDNRLRAFRFVVVDEAFSKSDEGNARYAMNLFQQLDLQLLVVTPLDKTHVVEPYIDACHFVSNNQEENDSRVWNMTFAEYQAQKAHFATRSTVEV